MFESITKLNKGNMWKITRIEEKDSNGNIMMTKDGYHKKVKITFFCEHSGGNIWLSMITLQYKVFGLVIGDFYAIDETEPCVDISPKQLGPNKGQPRFAIDPYKVKDVRLLFHGNGESLTPSGKPHLKITPKQE